MPCITVKHVLEELKTEIPGLVVREVDLASREGLELAVKNNILYPPAVFIGGALFAKGKIYPDRLREAVRKTAEVA